MNQAPPLPPSGDAPSGDAPSGAGLPGSGPSGAAPPPVPGLAPGAGRPRPVYQPRKIACPNCGDQLEIKDETSRMAVCPSCGSHLEISLADAKVLRKAAGSDSLARVFQLQIGDHFKYQKVRYEVIGRLRLDELEEPEPTCNYLLFNPRRGTLWLSEYARHWDLSHTSRVMPGGDPRGLKKGDKLTTYDGQKWLLAGKGTYQVSWVDGALPWVAKVNDQIDYAELVAADGSGETYEVEYPQSGGQEMEAGRGSLLSVDEVRRATGKDIASPAGPRENIHGITKSFGRMWRAAALFMLFNLLCLLVFGMLGNKVLDQEFSPQELTGEVLSQPFQVDAGSVLKIHLRAPLRNEWIAVDLALVRDDDASSTEDDAVVHVTDSEFQYYSGRSGGESWSEGSKKKSQFLRVDEGGTYRLLLHAVSGKGNSQASSRSEVPVRVRVYDGVKRAVWMFLAFLGSTIALIVVFVQHQKWRVADDEDDEDDDWD